ncbi:MAG: transglutaminase domain-containing protein, partial [Acidobacteriota bacterium]|nr:transglutaminase domain-containing protein [Acidobacteriota bacterium]
KLYAAVQALDNTDYSRKKSESELKQLKLKQAKHVEDTWKQKSGDSEDMAMLYIAMARSAGLLAFAVKVVSRNRAVFDQTYMDIDQLDDTLVLVGVEGKGVLVDPGEKMCPFGTVNWRHSGTGGVRQTPAGPGYVTTPQQAYNNNTTERIGDIKLDAHGAVTGALRIVMTGQEALRWRQAALRNDETELKKEFDRTLEGMLPDGVEGHIDHFLGLDDAEVALMAVVNVKGTLGTATAKRLLLPGYFFEAREKAPFVSQEKRQEAVDMNYGERVSDQITYYLPAGMAVEGTPPDVNIPWTGHAAYVSKTVSAAGQVTVARTLLRGFAQAKPEEYQDLRGFYQKVAAADQQQLVLAAAPATASAEKGN